MQQFSLANYMQQQQANPTPMPAAPANTAVAQTAPTGLWQQSLDAFTNPNSALMRDATFRGMEFAQERGGLNSSIAAGAARRATLDAAAGMATGAAQMGQDSFMQERNAQLQNWMADQGLQREFAASLALMPVQNSFDMLNAIQQYAMSDPELYPPEVVNGMSNFFMQNMQQIMQSFFANQMGGGG